MVDPVVADRGGARGAQIARRPRIAQACSAMALASAFVAAVSVQALAADSTPPPAKDKVWGGCRLSATTVSALENDLEAPGGIGNNKAAVSFVVIYTLANDNNGQLLKGTDFTGAVICTNPSAVGITAFDKTGTNLLTETTDIPTQTGNAPSVDILEAEEMFSLKYQLNGGANAGDIEKRVCHTTDNNVDCFRIFPVP